MEDVWKLYNYSLRAKGKIMQFAWKITILTTGFLLIFSYANAGPNYESSWHEDFHLEITKTFAKNNIRGCGQYKYKTNLDYLNKEFLVFCTHDGKKMDRLSGMDCHW